MNDDGLIALVATGDDSALRALFSRHAPWLATRLRVVLPAADVEDVIQETFIAVWRGAVGYRPDGAAGGWLWGIARRQAALLLRRRGPGSITASDQTAVGEWPDADFADTVAVRTDLERAVASLGPPGTTEREVWRLLYVEDRPVAEVAEMTGVPPGTVKSRAHRARKRLRAALAVGGPAELGRKVMKGDAR